MESRMGATSPLAAYESYSRSSPARSMAELNTRPSPFNTNTQTGLNQSFNLQKLTMAELTSHHDISPLLDSEVVRFLQHTLVGIDSNLVMFTNNGLEIPHGFSNSHQYFLKDLFELALLYRYLSTYVHNTKQMESPIKRAFLTSVRSYLEEYSYFIENLFHNNDLTLQEAYNACYYPWLFQVRFINTLFKKYFDTDRNIPGDQLLSKMYSLSKFGDLNLSSLTFLGHCMNPYFEILEHWLLRGELIDHANEFFIRFDESKMNFNEMIIFDASRVPRFFTLKVAKRVYHIGKMITFLSKVCHELEWVDKYISSESEIIQKKIQGSLQFHDNLESLIDSLYHQLLKKFTSVIHGSQNELLIHILNLKDILLTNRNDLIEQTIRKSSPLLNHVASDISGSYLTRLLNESLSTLLESKFRYLNRIDARLLTSDHGSIGWDVFTFDYRLEDLPIHHIINYRDSFREYLKIFNFFWKVKHLQYCLDQLYLKTFKKTVSKTPQTLRLHLRNISIIRNQMSLFLSFLMSYFCYNIVEELFQKHIVQNLFKSNLGNTLQHILLNRFVKSVRDNSISTNSEGGNKSLNDLTMDELVDLHTTYLKNITSNKLLSTEHVGSHSKQSFIMTIYDILTTINKFEESSTVFYACVEEYEHEVLLNLSQMLEYNNPIVTSLMARALRDINQRGKELYNEIYQTDGTYGLGKSANFILSFDLTTEIWKNEDV
ncbi:Microtubule-nucleating Tub4p (gamma-tubulin) complex component [Scheffersomyces spartinae]|uniref:Spindle pole body component n=1 Tax=Scheffersomyces spartinae TaxID=45513 RepID=A0A9P7VD83_9ASCO|nr:Microtubule-nucleating Tub4p (gamma-tubulin) complex component [Scheffersomyces spartinae]KAG7195366.1 Microtubule-nucleating Tub4p (gamma-tubulin) complex component [Scheffersomyces spartinae]